MSQPRGRKPLEWSAIVVLAALGGVVVLGQVALGLTLAQAMVGLGFIAGGLLIAWLWQRTDHGARTAPPLTGRQWAWQAAVFVVWLAVSAALVWWFLPDRQGKGSPAARPARQPADPPAVADPAEQLEGLEGVRAGGKGR
jgi:hypothetical protein